MAFACGGEVYKQQMEESESQETCIKYRTHHNVSISTRANLSLEGYNMNGQVQHGKHVLHTPNAVMNMKLNDSKVQADKVPIYGIGEMKK